MKKTWSILTAWEKIVITLLIVVMGFAGTRVASAFIDQHSVITPQEGGVYIEGMAGRLGPLNPLLAPWGSITYDITQLVFSGLTRYDPATQEMIPDLADLQISSDKRVYTFTLKKGAQFHDGAPVTSADVLFTYNDVIKNPDFKGAILHYIDLTGVLVEATDDRTVKFTLSQPDSFFLVKTMAGILPRHLLGPVPFENWPFSDFSQFPIGSGRYKLVSVLPLGDHTEVSLEAAPDYYAGKPHIPALLFKIFPDAESLMKSQGGLNGIRQVPPDSVQAVLKKGKLLAERYYLPQYVAAFLNTESPFLKNRKVRLALQLATDKKSIAEILQQTQIIDTPLLEIDQGNWIHQFSLKRANGALFETEWQIPHKEELIQAGHVAGAEPVSADIFPETAEVTHIRQPNEGKDFRTSQSPLKISGTAPVGTQKMIVNDYELRKFGAGQTEWSYVASPDFDSLIPGKNVYEVFAVDAEGNKNKIDAITIVYDPPTPTPTMSNADVSPPDADNENAQPLPTRRNQEGKLLTLTLITPQTPPAYAQVAQLLKTEWQKIGVETIVEALDEAVFQERMNKRQYDVLIFGQNLGYNLDAYPYWHSSQAKEGGYNLSQFKNFAVDSLLEKARMEYDKKNRQETLKGIQKIMSEEVPAIFLYSPTYTMALSPAMQNVTLTHLATSSDRFADIQNWTAKTQRTLKPDIGVRTFLSWLIRQF